MTKHRGLLSARGCAGLIRTTYRVGLLVLALPICRAEEKPARLVVASLNPIATDLARQVGGERVEVIELMKPGANPHDYQPSAAELRRAGTARLYLAMGKKLETYLPRVRDALGAVQKIVELGRTVPSLKLRAEDALFKCCPDHAREGIDPHWWHSVPNVKRAVRELAKAFAEADPPNAGYYDEKYKRYGETLDALDAWVKREVGRIPRQDRKLATPHAAFNYFCREYGFEVIPIKGLTTEEEVRPAHLAEVADTIRREKIGTIFAESAGNRQFVEVMARETGAAVGGDLLSGSPTEDKPTYEAIVRHNVQVIVKALAPKE